MSANSKPAAPITLKAWLNKAEQILIKNGISSARLDAQLLLAHAFKKDREWLLAHDDEKFTTVQLKKADTLLKRRLKHEPLAYITGYKEFYGREFTVNASVLIPRPETENMIELLKGLSLPEESEIIDVGTGSGVLAVTAALELPKAKVIATDISREALRVARKNAKSLGAKIKFYESDLLSDLPLKLYSNSHSPIAILANLPYVSSAYPISEEAKAEPSLALFADADGFELINRLLPQAADIIAPNGYLLLESDPWQQERIFTTAAKYGFKRHSHARFHVVLQKTN